MDASLNTASVLIQLKRHSAEITVYVFKYSICSYSTCAGMMQCDPPVMFKYSICSYSTQSRKSKYSLPRCLNTASVLIQQVPIVAVCYVDVFKYSICSYSTCSIIIFSKKCVKFKYSICSYSTNFPFGSVSELNSV